MRITNDPFFAFDQQVPIYNWFFPLCYEENLSDYVPASQITGLIDSEPVTTRALYFHIPFCDTICSFCPFVRGTFEDTQVVEDYTHALIKEISVRAKTPAYTAVPINSIFFGGGTPSILSADQIRRIGKAIRDHFDLSGVREFSFEIEVKSLDESKVEAMAEIGVTHGRFGLQTFDPVYRELFTLTATIEQCTNAVELMRRHLSVVSFDMLYSMNGQSFDQLARDIGRAVQLGNSNIDIYPVNNLSTQLRLHESYQKRGMPPATATDKAAMRIFIDEMMRSRGFLPHNGHGYVRKPVDATAPGPVVYRDYVFEYHKSVYGYEDSDTLGFGVSAMSSARGVGIENHPNRRTYIRSMLDDGDCPARYRTFNDAEIASKGVIMHLPYFGHLAKSSVDWSRVHPETRAGLDALISAGLAVDAGDEIRISRTGWIWYTNLMYFLHPQSDKDVLRASFERRLKQPGRMEGELSFPVEELYRAAAE